MMDRTIGYLREILSNYTDQYPEAQEIYNKIKKRTLSFGRRTRQ
ncbi:hypothetical protein KEH51_01125 [[Brevibacterium] frigoritolerans]|uniref:Uncharacterized protein n=1 Tax=Peribacillus frigoritolerans TaxID=450367 RepID=A0A941FP50_9BACI|nr:hypothetical protein [Peribacillus frigoritolerans]